MSDSIEMRLNGARDIVRASGDSANMHEEAAGIIEGVLKDLGLESYRVCENCSYRKHRLVRAEHSYVDRWDGLLAYCDECWPEQIANAREYGWIREEG